LSTYLLISLLEWLAGDRGYDNQGRIQMNIARKWVVSPNAGMRAMRRQRRQITFSRACPRGKRGMGEVLD
jgi:hypothetical protein